MRKLGMDLAPFSNGTAAPPRQASLIDGMQSLGSAAAAKYVIDSLKQNNHAQSLENPRLVTTSGQPAALHAGGTFPVPSPPGAASAVEFKEYGPGVTLKAEALGNNRVRLNLHLRRKR